MFGVRDFAGQVPGLFVPAPTAPSPPVAAPSSPFPEQLVGRMRSLPEDVNHGSREAALLPLAPEHTQGLGAGISQPHEIPASPSTAGFGAFCTAGTDGGGGSIRTLRQQEWTGLISPLPQLP